MSRTNKLIALVLAVFSLTTASLWPVAPASADGPNVIENLPRQIIVGQCPAGVTITAWYDFQKRTDTGARRAVRGGVIHQTMAYPFSRVEAYSYAGSAYALGTVNYSTPTANASAYSTGPWGTRSAVSGFVAGAISGGGSCGYHFGSP